MSESIRPLKVITVGTHSERYFPCLVETCEKFGYYLVQLGYGERWQGFAWRMRKIADYVRDYVPQGEPVVILDAFDAIMLRPASETGNHPPLTAGPVWPAHQNSSAISNAAVLK